MSLERAVRKKIRLQRITLWLDRFYAVFSLPIAIFILLIGVTLLGGWAALPVVAARVLALIGAVLGVGLFVFRVLLLFGAATRERARRALETANDLTPGTLKDASDSATATGSAALWAAHREKLEAAIPRLKLAGRRAPVNAYDPWRVRYLAALFAPVALVLGSTSMLDGLRPLVQTQTINTAFAPFDLWVEPPAYTQQPPAFLMRRGTELSAAAEPVTVIAGSRLRATGLAAGGRGPRVALRGADESERTRLTINEGDNARWTLDQLIPNSGTLTVPVGSRRMAWDLEVAPDLPPSVAWGSDVEDDGANGIAFDLITEDDFGIETATLALTLNPDQPRALDLPDMDTILSTAPPTEIELSAAVGAPGEARLRLDLTDHPWAGLSVNAKVTVTDGRGQVAETALQGPFWLPERTFYNEVARVVVEERQNVALVENGFPRLAVALDALTTAPDALSLKYAQYVPVRFVYHSVSGTAPEAVVKDDVVDSLWELALALEDSGVVGARERLEAAQRALREALERGASDEELEELMADLRRAVQNYLSALAASGDAFTEADPSSSVDIDELMDDIETEGRMGNADRAEDLLNALAQLLENAQISTAGSGEGGEAGGQSGQGSAGEGEGQGQGQGAAGDEELDAVGELLDRQRGLSDETFGAAPGDAPGLANEQNALAGEAEAFADALDEMTGPGGLFGEDGLPDGAQQAFESASEAMQGAAEALQNGEPGLAQAYQERALEQLRRGGEALKDAVLAQREKGQGREGGEDGAPSAQNAETGSGLDPLGRAYRSNQPGTDIVPNLRDPARVRELLRAVRERLADPDLGDAERRYLEGLLESF